MYIYKIHMIQVVFSIYSCLWVIQLSLVDTPGAIPLEKWPSLLQKASSVRSSLATGGSSWTPPLHARRCADWTLCRQPQLLWAHEHSYATGSRRLCFFPVVPNLWFWQYSCSLFPDGLWASRKVCEVNLPSMDEHPWTLTPWNSASCEHLCLPLTTIQRLMSSESCTKWVVGEPWDKTAVWYCRAMLLKKLTNGEIQDSADEM